MIYTITLNPALDISGTVDHLTPDEKSYVTNEIHTPGGNGINAAIIAHRLGADVIATGLLGGANGKEIEFLLDKERLRHDFVHISGSTRMNLTVSNLKTLRQTRLSFPGPEIKKNELKRLISSLESTQEGDIVLIGGSLPPHVSPQSVARLIRSLNKKNIICFVDVPGRILAEVIPSRPYFIKPNLSEFQELTGRKVKTISSILPIVKQLNKKVPLICVSSVEDGALLVNKNEACFGKIPKVKIRSTVGAGDSMVGAIAQVIARNPSASLDELLREGLAASCATLSEEGMILGSRRSIQHYKKLIFIQQLK